jgi:REP element-mobilizing transposase RayT
VDRRETFSSDSDRLTYLQLLWQNLKEAEVRLLGWCLMPNHVHLIAEPEREDSLALLLRRVHGRYAQYYNARVGRSGHLWQNRFFACVLSESHLWTALAYVDLNPVRAGMVENAAVYPWSSAPAHLSGVDPRGLLDEGWWHSNGPGDGWVEELGADYSVSGCCDVARIPASRSAMKRSSSICRNASTATGCAAGHGNTRRIQTWPRKITQFRLSYFSAAELF